ncbi:tripartite motif-containing protein 3-like [Lingula anatina]|uniref:Tripartite motif-containing protein 3-like n=1 Tax=Lingula anatina TaxID=7574 RepID=A0A1S3J1J6_LINAN|nr:tripartite motif-containing protein 3-like [Lingula anatina]|eukprot:XP_013404133.1 tripartite motif-containing protein 3-like [Lingula anatina]
MAEVLAADIKENILTCNICLVEYEDPRVLPCYHTFCYGCISDHATRTLTSNRTFLCPVCREEIQFPAGGLNQLKKNFIFSKTKDIITKQQVGQTLEEEQATVAAVTQAIAQMTISCEKHLNNELKYYCEDDDTVICCECIITEHSGHRISSVEQVAKCNRDKIKAALVRTMKTTDMFKESVAMETANDTEDSHIKTLTITNMKKQAQIMHKLIDQRVETLISELNSAYDVRKKQKEANKDILEFHHSSLHSACDFAQELITNGTDSEIMLHAKSLIERLAAMEKTPVPTPDTPAQISYKPGEISTDGLEAMLGQVTVQSQSPLAGLETNPRSAPNLPVFLEKAECVRSFSAVVGDDKGRILMTGLTIDERYTCMYVVDGYESWRRRGNDRTKMFTHDGEFKFYIELNNPFDVAVSQTGHMYMTSLGDKCVKVYSTKGKQVTTMGHGLLEDPRGITLNRQGHVMVCDRGKMSIFTFYAASGQLLDTIPLNMCADPQYITVNSVNDNIVISDFVKHCVHVLSPTGDQLYQYVGNGQLRKPCGVCTDSNGHIFIAEWGKRRIVALSPQGYFIRYIATKADGLNSPIALAINPAGQLVVAEEWGRVKIFQYLQ